MFLKEYAGLTRSQLEHRLRQAEVHVDDLQKRGTELVMEKRDFLAGILLRGWHCRCGAFNGSEKAPRAECRACGKARPT